VFQVAAIDVADIDLPGQDDIPTDDGVHYDVIDGATKRGKKKLISTDGFTYTVKKRYTKAFKFFTIVQNARYQRYAYYRDKQQDKTLYQK